MTLDQVKQVLANPAYTAEQRADAIRKLTGIPDGFTNSPEWQSITLAAFWIRRARQQTPRGWVSWLSDNLHLVTDPAASGQLSALIQKARHG